MTRNLAVLIAALGLGSAAFSPAEFMLCIHRDGQVVPEDFREDCCQAECENACGERTSPECPDDQCRDVPVAVTPDTLQETAPAVDREGVSSPAELADPAVEALTPTAESIRPPGSLDPPILLLRSRVLRL